MSGRSVTITIGTTGSIRALPAPSNGVKLAGEDKDKMYETKPSKKMVRVLTVIVYMFTVSLAAIMLSVYYVFLWSPRYAKVVVVHQAPPPPPSSAAAPVGTMATDETGATRCSCPTVAVDGDDTGGVQTAVTGPDAAKDNEEDINNNRMGVEDNMMASPGVSREIYPFLTDEEIEANQMTVIDAT